MKKKDKLLQKELFLWKLDEIVNLYSVSSISALFYDLVTINSKPSNRNLINTDEIEKVEALGQMPDRSGKLEKLLSELFEIAKNQPLGMILKE